MIIKIKLNEKVTDCIIDDEDYSKIDGFRWRLGNDGYAKAAKYLYTKNGKEFRQELRMHRLIMGAPMGVEVDHINHDKLDNRRSNLRLCDRKQNKANTRIVSTNTSGYKGVSLHRGKWQASIRIDGKLLYLGAYNNIVDAAIQYNKKAYEVWGEFAWLNPIRQRDMAGA